MQQNSSWRYGRGVLAALVVMLCGILLFTPSVGADDHATGIETYSGDKFYFSLTTNPGITRIHLNAIGLYYDSPGTKTVTLNRPWSGTEARKCRGDFIVGVDYANANGRQYLYAAKPCESYRSFSIYVPDVKNADTGKYKAVLYTYVRSGAEKRSHFRFSVSTNGLVRSLAEQPVGFESTVYYHPPSHGEYALRFGSECRMTSSRRVSIGIYDPDNSGEPRKGVAQRYRKFEAQLIGSPKGQTPRLLHRWIPGNVSDAWEYQTVTVHPDWRYELRFVGLDHNNTIQAKLPFDSIYYDVSCNQWSVAGTSRVTVNGGSEQQRATARPGDRVRFNHALRNDSSYTIPANTLEIGLDQSVNGGSRSYHAWANKYDHVASAGHVFYTPRNVAPYNNVFAGGDRIGDDDVGKEVCQQISWRPRSWNVTDWGASGSTTGWACVTVPHEYTMWPAVSAPPTIAQGQPRVPGITASINNHGPTKSKRANYAVARFVVRGAGANYTAPSGEGVTIPYDPARPGNLRGDWDCYIAREVVGRSGVSVSDCTSQGLVQNGSGTEFRRGVSSILSSGSDDISTVKNLTAGDRICYMALVSTYTHHGNTATFRYVTTCAKISVLPKVQFWGADVRTYGEGSIRTGKSEIYRGSTEGSVADKQIVHGLRGTGLDHNGNTITYAAADREPKFDAHWRVQTIRPGTNNTNPCQGTAGSSWQFNNPATVVHQQYQRQFPGTIKNDNNEDVSLVRGPGLVSGVQWSTAGAGGAAWISSNIAGSNYYYQAATPGAGCSFPAWQADDHFKRDGSFDNEKITKEAPTWSFETSFHISNALDCEVDLTSLRLAFKLGVDDRARLFINDVAVTDYLLPGVHDIRTASFAGASSPYRRGVNRMRIDVQSFSQFTGIMVGKDIAVEGGCKPNGTYATYGSWAEYGLFAQRDIVSSSGAGLSAAPIGRSSIHAQEYNSLTFQNATAFGQFGHMATPRVPDLYFAPTGTDPFLGGSVRLDAVAAGRYRAGNVTIGGTVAKGRQIVIRASGTVTIDANLVYQADTYTTSSDVPQLVIIAKDIIIRPEVTQVDAWLVASSGTVNTCDTVVRPANQWLSGLDVPTCSKQLQINGPVIARHLQLRRTHHKPGMTDGDHPGIPAEILNLRPDAYMWGSEYAKRSGIIKTMYLRELPPRY